MSTDRSLAIMKALADESRLAIVHSLLERSQYAEEISRRHALAPSTVSFHLRKLEQAGLVTSRKEQYYVIVNANDEVFNTTLREIVGAHKIGRELQDDRMEEYRRKVVEAFFRNGRLQKLPAQHKKRLIVLDLFARRFESGRRYSEQEVTGLIVPLFEDYCTIRRLLVDEGLVRRDDAGYWREPGSSSPDGVVCPVPEGAAAKSRREPDPRSELKRLYKQNRPDMGVYQIRNRVNGKLYVGCCENMEGTRTSRMFQLRMGKAVFSTELQKDLIDHGADVFEFTPLDLLEKPDRGSSVEQALAALHLRWLEKLQPFGDRGYNSIRAFERLKAQQGHGEPQPQR